MDYLWGILTALGIQAILVIVLRNVLKGLFLKTLNDWTVNTLDPWMEKTFGDKTATQIQAIIRDFLREYAQAWDQAIQQDSYPNTEEDKVGGTDAE